MSGNELRAEYERLARQIADALGNPQAAAASEAGQLLERLASFSQQCVDRIVEAEAPRRTAIRFFPKRNRPIVLPSLQRCH